MSAEIKKEEARDRCLKLEHSLSMLSTMLLGDFGFREESEAWIEITIEVFALGRVLDSYNDARYAQDKGGH